MHQCFSQWSWLTVQIGSVVRQRYSFLKIFSVLCSVYELGVGNSLYINDLDKLYFEIFAQENFLSFWLIYYNLLGYLTKILLYVFFCFLKFGDTTSIHSGMSCHFHLRWKYFMLEVGGFQSLYRDVAFLIDLFYFYSVRYVKLLYFNMVMCNVKFYLIHCFPFLIDVLKLCDGDMVHLMEFDR